MGGQPPSQRTLRDRLRQHYALNAAGSTLRLTLGCLLAETLQIELRRVGSGKRMTFTRAGEQRLNEWMEENARVCWYACREPWIAEEEVIGLLDLPLNLAGNRAHAFHGDLSRLRASQKARARDLPVFLDAQKHDT